MGGVAGSSASAALGPNLFTDIAFEAGVGVYGVDAFRVSRQGACGWLAGWLAGGRAGGWVEEKACGRESCTGLDTLHWGVACGQEVGKEVNGVWAGGAHGLTLLLLPRSHAPSGVWCGVCPCRCLCRPPRAPSFRCEGPG